MNNKINFVSPSEMELLRSWIERPKVVEKPQSIAPGLKEVIPQIRDLPSPGYRNAGCSTCRRRG